MAHISSRQTFCATKSSADTELGREAAKLMKEGKLVPDEVIAGMVRERLAQPDCDNGFILDGFPRTIRQAELLEEALSSLGRKLDRVVYFKVDDDVILKRLTARLNCRKCGKIYNKLFSRRRSRTSATTAAPSCSSGRTTRSRPLKSRLEVFYRQTSPLIDYYRKQGLMLEITETDKDKICAVLAAELE